MTDEQIFTLIGKVITGNAIPEEKFQLENWKKLSVENQRTFDELQKLWTDTTFEPENTDAPFQRFKAKLDKSGEIQPQERRIWQRWLSVAAILAVLAGVIGWLSFSSQTSLKVTEHADAFNIKINPPGQKSKIHLPDGSVVWLNAESELRYPFRFDSANRTVELIGEAFFEVMPDSKRPFSVRSGDLTTVALGTSFNIDAYRGENSIRIILATGKIKVLQNSESPEFLEPGQGLEYKKLTKTITTGNYDVESIIAWKDGILFFNHENFEGIIAKLERWYGVNIEVTGLPGPEISYTGKFTNEYLNNVLESMSFGRPFHYLIEDKDVYINFTK